MPTNRRGNLSAVKKVLVEAAIECHEEGVNPEVAQAVVNGLSSIVNTAVANYSYQLEVGEYSHGGT